MATRIYSYGAKAPQPLQFVEYQLFAAHRYRNKLVEIELKRRAASDAALIAAFPDLQALHATMTAEEKKVEEAVAKIAASNAAARLRTQTKEQKAEVKRLRRDFYAARKLYALRRKAAYADEAFVKTSEQIADSANEEVKAARAACNCYWGTYLTVEQAAMAFRKGAPPHYRRYGREGRVAVQLQGGLSVADFMAGTDTRLRCGPHATGIRTRTVSLRVGTADKAPVFATIPVFFADRPLPEGASIKWAWMLARRTGTHVQWFFQFTLTGDDALFAKEQAPSGRVGIDVGWRLTDEGLRVAKWMGSDGRSGELVLEHRFLSRWSKSDSLRSIRDRNFNDIRTQLGEWKGTHKAELPDWFTERTKTLHLWRSQAQLASVVIHWRMYRFAGDAAMFDAAEAWRKQDKHLYDWQEFNRAKAQRWRDDKYRNFAAMIRKGYQTAAVENTNWADMQELKPLEQRASVDDAMRKNQKIASVGRLLQLIAEGQAVLEKCPAENTTRLCSACGQLTGEINAAALFHTCAHCGITLDQDENAARNLLNYAAPAELAAV